MTIKMILQGDVPELRQTSSPITHFDKNLASLLDDLTDTLIAHRGLGLSAPQIGVFRRVFVVDLGFGVQEFVNPKIVGASGEIEEVESCLSFPGHIFKIARASKVTVKALDRTGNPVQLEATDLLARIICHEIAHLDGILFMDHLSEAELFAQLLGNELDWNDGNTDALGARSTTHSSDGQHVQLAQQHELQLSADLLAELAWKLVLSLEILRDYQHLFEDGAIRWNQLENISELLTDTIQVVETCMVSLDA